MPKTYTDEKGQVLVTLPVSKTAIAIRQPKGRDLKAIELASQGQDKTNIGLMMLIASLLITTPGFDIESIEELDAEDVEAIGEAIGAFRVFSKNKAK